MATNAPYYQMRAGQLPADTNSATAAVQTETARHGDFGSASITATKQPAENHLPLSPERAARQSGLDGHSDFEENHNLVELLEAATTAADQDPMAMHASKTAPAEASTNGKRKRDSTLHTGAATPAQNDRNSTSKRRRIDTTSTDPNLESTDVDTHMRSPVSKTSPSPARDSLLFDTRAAGVHSAAALFRRSSSNASRKYTRPPMSKLFMSLNITPENFIALQALAKEYMLSPAHTERQSCVGNRGKGDTDMVKLRLFNCVRDFLADGGVGERFFGEHVEKPGERESNEAAAALGEESGGEKLEWPRDGNKIISLVTPLMRRMVTNERQRLYAIDTRKGGKKPDKESSIDAHCHPSSPTPEVEQHLQALDPTLQHPVATQHASPSSPFQTPRAKFLNATTPPTSTAVLTPTKTSLTSLTSSAAEPHLTNLNIFLLSTIGASRPIKLDEKRISTTRPAHLTFYNYTAFLEQVAAMVKRAELLHSVVKSSGAEAVEGHKSSGTAETELRGLAAAASALHDDEHAPQPMATASVPGAGAGAEGDVGPRYTVKTIGPTGWRVIDSAESWYNVLTERAFAVWADGVCNIVVEMGGRSTAEGSDEVLMEDAQG